MDRVLEEKLAKEFPFMRRRASLSEQVNKSGSVSDLYGAFGCEVGDGWYNLLRELCVKITEIYSRNNTDVDIVIDQVKEKYGGLCFYYHRNP